MVLLTAPSKISYFYMVHVLTFWSKTVGFCPLIPAKNDYLSWIDSYFSMILFGLAFLGKNTNVTV